MYSFVSLAGTSLMQTNLLIAKIRQYLVKKRLIPAILLLCQGSAIALELTDDLTLEPSARYRFQDVNDSWFGDAQASILKFRLSADWQPTDNWQGFVQYDLVEALNDNRYNSVTIRRETSPIPDPEGHELNQFYVKYISDDDWQVMLGRQSASFNNERHVGTVEFWQNDQTFDAFRLDYNDNLKWSASYLYIDKVHTILGDDAGLRLSTEDIRFSDNPIRPVTELGNQQHKSHLLNLSYQLNQQTKLSLYSYLIDNQSVAIFSSDTYGAKFEGEFKPKKIKYGYTFEYARQSNSGNSPWRFDADYLLLEASAQFKSHQLTLSYEKLGEDNGFGFATTLGTNHKFQGWADVFTNYLTRGGLKDTFLTYRGRQGKLRWRLVAHQFDSATGGITAGHELDFELAYRYDRQWEFKFIGAKYFADEGFSSLPSSQFDLSTWMLSAAYNL
jgi:hypothetical protein